MHCAATRGAEPFRANGRQHQCKLALLASIACLATIYGGLVQADPSGPDMTSRYRLAVEPAQELDRVASPERPATEAGRWYGIYQQGVKVGFAQFADARDDGGTVTVSSETWLALREGWLRERQTLKFGNEPGQPLIAADTFRQRGPQVERQALARIGTTGSTRYARYRDGVELPQTARLQYSLPAHRALELALASAVPRPGTDIVATSLNLNEMAVLQRTWHVSAVRPDQLSPNALLVELTADGARTEYLLPDSGEPTIRTLSIGSVTKLRLEAAASASTGVSPLLHPFRTIPLANARHLPPGWSTARSAHYTIARDAVDVLDRSDRQQADLTPDGATLSVHSYRSTPVRPAERRAALAPTAAFPADDGQILALAAKVPPGPEGVRVTQIMSLVQDQLAYDPNQNPLGVNAALAAGRGDCTEFASVFIAVARAVGLPARPVSGLASAARAPIHFALHAWAEVAINGAWVEVDPTWLQMPADVTHIRFPEQPEKLLRTYELLPALTLEYLRTDR